MAEPVVVGNLVFEVDEDSDGKYTVSIHKVMDLEGWVTFAPCPDLELEWAVARNNSYPLNGTRSSPPYDTWVVEEYVGKEGSSLSMDGERSEKGFTNAEIADLLKVVNLFYGTPSRLRVKELPEDTIVH